MSTLNESINAKIASLEAEIAALRSKADQDIALVQAQIDEAKAHLTGLRPYLEHEVAVAKDEVVAFFAKLGV